MNEVKNENYASNLKIFIESKRKDLDIVLTTTIPTQKNLMKTLLWLNSTIIGLCIAGLTKSIGIIFYSIPFFSSTFAIFIILYSLKKGQVKHFGGMSLDYINSLYSNPDQKLQGLYDLANSIENAFEKNLVIVEQRARNLSISTNCTIISIFTMFIGIVFYVNIYLMKGG